MPRHLPPRGCSARVARLASALLALALALSGGAAWAGRPLVTEDAGDVLEVGKCDLESYAARLHQPWLSYQWAQFNCGTGHATQLSAGAGRENAGAGYLAIAGVSGKTSLRKLGEQQAGIAIAYALLGGKHVDHLRHESSEIKAVLTVPDAQWLFHANLGWVRNYAYRADKVIWALAVERPQAVGAVDLMAEVFGDDRASPWAQLAARWTLIPGRLFLDSSWGAQFNASRTRQATLGLKLAF